MWCPSWLVQDVCHTWCSPRCSMQQRSWTAQSRCSVLRGLWTGRKGHCVWNRPGPAEVGTKCSIHPGLVRVCETYSLQPSLAGTDTICSLGHRAGAVSGKSSMHRRGINGPNLAYGMALHPQGQMSLTLLIYIVLTVATVLYLVITTSLCSKDLLSTSLFN